MELISKLSTEIFEKFVSYKKVLFYIKKWQFQIGYNVRDENFSIEYKG
ncbi:MAG: hypothetical protein LBQ59_01210 [Candidatus Peribacteria bacterium]|nr:hypothetical protein [Candidatus Peribacteria bacterium]